MPSAPGSSRATTPPPPGHHAAFPSSASHASTSSHLPSLLRGLQSNRRTSAQATISRPETPQNFPEPSAARASPSRTHRAPLSLRRSISTASLAPPSLTLPEIVSTQEAETSPLVEQEGNPSEAGSDSDASSGFEGLLERVGGSRGGLKTLMEKSEKAKGKEKALETMVGVEGPHADSAAEELVERAPEQVVHGQLEGDGGEEEDDDEGDVELVEREEGQPDPRDMLRAQLRRNESIGRHGKLSRSSSHITTSEERMSLDLAASPPTSVYSPRRYFILSSAGKLVFTTDRNEEEATGYVGVMQAIISIFADERDKLRYVDAGATKIAFLLKAPLYLVCVSDWNEPESVLRSHLDYLYLQVLSVVTLTQLTNIFSKRSNFDLRRLMEGTETFFTTLAERLQTSLAILTNSLEVYRVDASVRDEVAKALAPPKPKTVATSLSLLYAIVISHGRLVTLLRPTSHSIHPTDLHLLLSTIASSATFRTPDSESWIPICLPRFNNKGFLHAYISFLSEGTGVVLVSAERDAFEGVKKYGEEVKQRLRDKGTLHRLEMRRRAQTYSLGELAIPGLRHFLYKSKVHVQVTHPAYEGDYEDDTNKFRLITLYQRIHEAIHIRPTTAASGGAPRPPSKLVYLRTEHEAVLGWTTSRFELYLAVSPLLPKTAVVSAARAVTRWIIPEEDKLFLTSAPTF